MWIELLAQVSFQAKLYMQKFYTFDKTSINTTENGSCLRNFKVKYKIEWTITDRITCEIQESTDQPTNRRIKFTTYLFFYQVFLQGSQKGKF